MTITLPIHEARVILSDLRPLVETLQAQVEDLCREVGLLEIGADAIAKMGYASPQEMAILEGKVAHLESLTARATGDLEILVPLVASLEWVECDSEGTLTIDSSEVALIRELSDGFIPMRTEEEVFKLEEVDQSAMSADLDLGIPPLASTTPSASALVL